MRRARPLLGTIVDIRVPGDASAAERAVDLAFAAVARVQRLMSAHGPASDVSRINRALPGVAITVDAWTEGVLHRAQELNHATGGLFDCCVAPLLQESGYLPRWGHSRRRTRGRHDDIELPGERTVKLRRPLQITLDGIAKGFAVDQAVRLLQEAGIASGVVNAGGDLRVFGPEAKVIHVRDPGDPGRLLEIGSLRSGAVATSAAYFSHAVHAGRTVSHIFNPKTGRTCPADASASVVARDCMTADALAKAVLLDPAGMAPTLALLDAHAVIVKPGKAPCAIAA